MPKNEATFVRPFRSFTSKLKFFFWGKGTKLQQLFLDNCTFTGCSKATGWGGGDNAGRLKHVELAWIGGNGKGWINLVYSIR